MTSEAVDNTMFAFGDHEDNDFDYTANGLNQYTQLADNATQPAGVTAYSYDTNGNFTSDGETTWTYDNGNRLVEAVDTATGTEQTIVRYDPLGRMYEVSYDDDTSDSIAPSVRRLYYDGYDLVLEYGSNGAMMHRYVHGVSAGDDPLVQYDGSATNIGYVQLLYADRLGSITAMRSSRQMLA